jgi:S-adenosylmethionine:tRNA ribosyltransferase-isomerase
VAAMDYIPKARTEDYDYHLPESRIAKYPLGQRDLSKLLFADAKSNKISHHAFYEISELLPEDSLLVVNNTKVIQARFKMQKPTGGKAELLCVEPIEPSRDPQIVMKSQESVRWICIVGGRKINEGMELVPEISSGHNLKARIIDRKENEALVEFSWDGTLTFSEIVEETGKIPLPPYIKREVEENDKNSYQTVYAEREGSIAAPTAGLHFTDEVLAKVKARNIELAEVVLHVGPGTFKPVESDDISGHEMHSERISVNKNFIAKIIEKLNKKQKIVATGTTSLRTLESIYWIGAMIWNGEIDSFDFKSYAPRQWDSYRLVAEGELPTAAEAMVAIIELMGTENKQELVAYTQLLIVPGYEFRVVDALITNYHLPKSTLLLLSCGICGQRILGKDVQRSPMEKDYRFLSYGDSSLLMKAGISMINV